MYQNSAKSRQTTTVDIQQICLILAEHKSSPTLFLHFLTIIGILHHDPIYLDIFGPYQFDICTHIDLTVLGSLYFDILIHIDLTVFDPYFDTFGPYYFDIWTHTDLTHLQFRWNVLFWKKCSSLRLQSLEMRHSLEFSNTVENHNPNWTTKQKSIREKMHNFKWKKG